MTFLISISSKHFIIIPLQNAPFFIFVLLVPENEAEEILLPPDINELEDWENPVLPRENELKLQKRRADSQVF